MAKVFGYNIPEEYNLSDIEITLRNHGARAQGAYEIVVSGNGSLRYKSKTKERKADIDSLVVYSMLGDIYKTGFFRGQANLLTFLLYLNQMEKSCPICLKH